MLSPKLRPAAKWGGRIESTGPLVGNGAGGLAGRLVSPEVDPDRTVTFRLYAPNATKVTLTANWMATPTMNTRTGGVVPMTKGADGVWSYTSPVLDPTVQVYFFTVDGVRIADPANPLLKTYARSSASMVEVPGHPFRTGSSRTCRMERSRSISNTRRPIMTIASLPCICRRAIAPVPRVIRFYT